MESDLNIIVNATDNASAALQGIGNSLKGMADDASNASQSITQSLESARSVALQVGAVSGTAFAGIFEEIKTAGETNEKWNLSLADISNTLKDTGSSIPISEITSFAKSLSDSTLYSQQQVLSATQLVIGNKDLQGSFKDVLSVSSDLAAHMKTDLPSATEALSKVLNDPTTAIARLANAYNIDLDSASKKAIENMAKVGNVAGAQNAILKAIEDQIGGAAKAANDASGTGFVKLSNSIEDLQNSIGKGLNKTLDTLAKTISQVIDKVTEWVTAHPQLTSAILITLAAITGIITAVSAAIVIFATIGLAIAALVASPIALLLAAFTAIGVGLAVVGVIIVTHWNAIKSAFEEALNWIKNLILGWITDIEGYWNKVVDGAKIAWGMLTDFFKSLWVGIENIFIDGINGVIILIDDFIKTINNMLSLIKKIPGMGSVIGSIPLISMIPQATTSVSDAIISPNGNVITTDPADYLIASKNPAGLFSGSVGGNSSAVTINIGTLAGTDQNSARIFANQIAKMIGQNLKLKSY